MDSSELNSPVEETRPKYILGVLFGFLAVVLISASAFAFYFFSKGSLSPVDSQTEVPSVLEENRSLEKEASRLFDQLENTTLLSEEAQIKRAYALTNMRFDTSGSYALFREVAQNEEYPAIERALAVQSMGDAFLTRTSNTPSFALNYIFQEEEPYLAMGNEGRNDLERAWYGTHDLYEYATLFHPVPIASYRLAEWYTQEIENDPSATESLKYAIDHYEDGNNSLELFFDSISENDAYLIGQAMWLKGYTESRLFSLTGEVHYRAQAQESFDEAQRFLTSDANPAFAHELIWARLYYAEFLMEIGETEKIEDVIESLISSHTPSSAFSRYLDFLGTYEDTLLPHQQAEKERIAALGELNERFKSILSAHSF